MTNTEAIEQIKILNDLYEQKWGKKVDYLITPPHCSQEKLILVLQRIVKTGESLLVGWENIQ